MPLGSNRTSFNETDKVQIIYLHQGNSIMIPTIRYYIDRLGVDVAHGATIPAEEAFEVERKYRELGVQFGRSSGGGTKVDFGTVAAVPTLLDITLGGTYGTTANSPYGNTGTIEGICGATPTSEAADFNMGFTRGLTSWFWMDWLSVNIEPPVGVEFIRRGFAGDPTVHDRPIEAGMAGASAGYTAGPFFNPANNKPVTDFKFFHIDNRSSDDVFYSSVQLMKSYDQWIDQYNADGFLGEKPPPLRVTGGSGDPNVGVKFQNSSVTTYPTYYNVYRMYGHLINTVVDFCKGYVRGDLGFRKTPKVINWWQSVSRPIPLGGAGWFNHPPRFSPLGVNQQTGLPQGNTIVFSTDSLTSNAFSSRAFGPTDMGVKVYGFSGNDGRIESSPHYMKFYANDTNQSQWTFIAATHATTGSHANRSWAMAFEGASNSSIFLESKDMDCIVFQYYWGVYDKDFLQICATSNWDFQNFTGPGTPPGSVAGSGSVNQLKRFLGPATFVTTNPGSVIGPTMTTVDAGETFLPMSSVETTVYKSLRLNWLAYWKYFGNKAAVGLQPVMDLALEGNLYMGHGTDHDTFERVHLKALYDPVTQEESIRSGLKVGEVLRPKYIVFWSAEYFYLRQAFGDNNSPDVLNVYKSTINGYYRGNLTMRFPPPSGVTVDWKTGTPWHRHLCRKFDEFALERIRRIRKYDSATSIRTSLVSGDGGQEEP